MEIVLTGASSFIGGAVCEELKREGHKVTALRHSFEEAGDSLPERADVWVHFAWAGAGSRGRSDKRIQEFNVEMSLSALRKAYEIGCKSFLFAGSQAEYGCNSLRSAEGKEADAETEAFTKEILNDKTDARLMICGKAAAKEKEPFQTEASECFPISEYGKAKLRFGELAGKASDKPDTAEGKTAGLIGEDLRKRNEELSKGRRMRYIHTRIFSVYGPKDHEHSLVNSAIKSFLEKRPMELSECAQDWNYLYIDDAANAIAALINSESAEGIYNIGSLDTRPLKSYIEELCKICVEYADRTGKNADGDQKSLEAYPEPAFLESEKKEKDCVTENAEIKRLLLFGKRGSNAEGAASLRPDISKLMADTGWRPETDFETGVIKTIEFIKKTI